MIDGVSRGALEDYCQLLLKWNKKINLISKNSEQDVWNRHVLDSLQLLKYIDPLDSVVDLGSGAGFPGVVLSICGVKDVTLIECDSRKVVFLRQATKGSVKIIEQKISKDFVSDCDVLISRGFSSIANILKLTTGIKRMKLLLLKGENYERELLEAQKDWLFNCMIHDSITSDKGKILEITDERENNFGC